MIDTDTGEILATRYANYSMNFGTKTDKGFLFCLRWINSALRGIRLNNRKNIELRFGFNEDIDALALPFDVQKKVDAILEKQIADYNGF